MDGVDAIGYNQGMKKKTLHTLEGVLLVVAAVGVYTLMLKNPDDLIFTLPVLLATIGALAVSILRAKK